jgi:hypothetical protein
MELASDVVSDGGDDGDGDLRCLDVSGSILGD